MTAEQGPGAFSLLDAARACGVSASAPYKHFESRAALMAELAAEGYAALGERLSAARDFQAMGQAYLAFAREEPGWYAAMFQPGSLASGAPAGHGGFARLMAHMPEGQQRTAAVAVWALSHGLASLERAGALGAEQAEAVLLTAVPRMTKG